MRDKYQERYLEHMARKRRTLNYPGDRTFWDVLRQRHSQRTFTSRAMGQDILDRIYEAVRLAPSSCNRQAILVQRVSWYDKDLVDSFLVGGRDWIGKASVILLLFADMRAYKSPAEVEFMPYLDAGFVAENIYLAAEALGIGACYVNPNIREENREPFDKQFNPLGLRFCGAMALGYYDIRAPEATKRPVEEIFYPGIEVAEQEAEPYVDPYRDPVPDELWNGQTVLEVGAYEGKWMSRVCAKLPDCQVYGFEPASRAYQIAVKRLKKYPNAHLSPVALRKQAGRASLCDRERDGANTFEWNPEHEPSEMVNAIDTADAVRPLGEIAVAHLNAEGGEVEILERLIETGLVKRIGLILIQWHPYPELVPRIAEIQRQLEETHVFEARDVWKAWKRKDEHA